MKTTISVILLLLFFQIAYAQRPEDNIRLKKELKQATQDTSKVRTLIDLSLCYRLFNYDSSSLFANQALELSRSIDFKWGEMNALARQGDIAIQLGDIPKGLNYNLQALRIAENNNLLNEASLIMSALGSSYNRLENYPEALKYFRKQIVASMANNKPGVAYGYLSLAAVFQKTGQLDSATFNIIIAKNLFQELNTIEPILNTRFGQIEFDKGNYQSALKFFNSSLKESEAIKDINRKSATLIEVARVYQAINKIDSSIIYAKEGLKAAEQLGKTYNIYEAAKFLAELYEDKDNKVALAYFKMAVALNDSVYSQKNMLAITDITNAEQERLREIEAAKLSYQNKLKQYGFLAGLGFLTIVAFQLYLNNRRKHNDNILLQSQKDEIVIQRSKAEMALKDLKSTQAQLIQSEKMASLGELTAGIAHEIQNPLNFVNNFSEVSSEMIDEMKEELAKGDIKEAEAISDDLKENLEKIHHHGNRASSIVKGMLEHSRTSSGKKELTDINALADEYLRLAYHGLRAKEKDFNAEMVTHFDPKLPKIEVIPQDIGRVFLNLINNAFQAVQEEGVRKKEHGDLNYQPKVSITTQLITNNQLQITITDNGPGIPDEIKDKIFQPFFTTKDTGQGTGLGLSLAYDIVKAHGGELTVESHENEGTDFTIKLSLS